MRVEHWRRKVCEGFVDYIHGGGYIIDEFVIPDLRLVVNKEAFFIQTPEQYTRKEEAENAEEWQPRFVTAVEVEDEQVTNNLRRLAAFAEMKEEAKNAETQVLTELSTRFGVNLLD